MFIANSLYYNLPKIQLNRLQHIQNSLAHAVVAARSSSPDRILKSLHWLKVQERIEYKIVSISSPQNLGNVIATQPPRSTRSSSVVTLLHPPVQSRLQVTLTVLFDVQHLCCGMNFPHSLRIPYQSDPTRSSSLSSSPDHRSAVNLSRLKKCLFSRSFPP